MDAVSDARIESSSASRRSADPSTPWSVDFAHSVDEKSRTSLITSLDNIPSAKEIGLHLAKITLERINKKKSKKRGASTREKTVKLTPTSIQLSMWPALLDSFDAKLGLSDDASSNALNVVGIAPTGTGKTMSYAIPIVSHCIRILLQNRLQMPHAAVTAVHGLVLVPTRELAIQVSKEFKLCCKVANKYLTKKCSFGANSKEGSSMVVESLAIYGGVDIETQRSSLFENADPSSQSLPIAYRSLIVAATAGRLLDILNSCGDGRAAASAFANLHAIVFDEADRIAVNIDMARQVDDIISTINREKRCAMSKDDGSGLSQTVDDTVSCLVSATLPKKVQQICGKWVPRCRVVIKVDSMKVGEGERRQLHKTKFREEQETVDDNDKNADTKCSTAAISIDSGGKRTNCSQAIDFASIPSNIIQTLHVCSSHKKPRKLVLTLQRIYKKSDVQSGRFTANNRLCIVFFAQIKTLKFASKLLNKEGLRCVELYGSLNQIERDRRLLEFRAGKTPILLASDVAARGVHIANVNYVINYDFPSSLDQYVHRCGRAGRKQAKEGETNSYPPTVYSFYPREFKAMADSTIELLRHANQWVDPNLLALAGTDKTLQSSAQVGRKRKRRRTKAGKEISAEKDEEPDNEFSFLGRIALKRASNVSDAEDSDE